MLYLLYGFWIINYLCSFFKRNQSHILKCIRVVSMIGFYMVYILSINSYLKHSEVIPAYISEANEDHITYTFKTLESMERSDILDLESLTFNADVGDNILVRYLNIDDISKINTYKTTCAIELNIIAIIMFVNFVLWGGFIAREYFKKNDEMELKLTICKGIKFNKVKLLFVLYCLLVIFIYFIYSDIVLKNEKNFYNSTNINTTIGTIIDYNIFGVKYEFVTKKGDKITDFAEFVGEYEAPVGSQMSVIYNDNNQSRLKNDILSNRVNDIFVWLFTPLIYMGIGMFAFYKYKIKALENVISKNLFSYRKNKQTDRDMFVYAFGIVGCGIILQGFFDIYFENYKSAIFMFFVGVQFIIFAIIRKKQFDNKNK